MVGFVEPLVATFARVKAISRIRSACYVTSSLVAVSLVSILSYSTWSELTLWGLDLNGITDFISNQVMLPVGGLMIAVFAGWVVSKQVLADEIQFSAPWQFSLWHGLIKGLLPLAILVILISGLAG